MEVLSLGKTYAHCLIAGLEDREINDMMQDSERNGINFSWYMETLCLETVRRFRMLCCNSIAQIRYLQIPDFFDIHSFEDSISRILDIKCDVCLEILYFYTNILDERDSHIFSIVKLKNNLYRLESSLSYDEQTVTETNLKELMLSFPDSCEFYCQIIYYEVPEKSQMIKNAENMLKTKLTKTQQKCLEFMQNRY